MGKDKRRNISDRKRSRSRWQEFAPVLFVLCAAALLAVIFFLSGVSGNHPGSQSSSAEAENTRKLLSSMEAKTPADPESFRQSETLPEPEDIEETDINGIQSELLEHFGEYDYNSENFARWFENAAIVGDSVAETISEFGWLYDQNLQAQIGISLQTCDEVLDGTVWLQPKTIFLTFSANNIASYGVGIETYIDDYKEVIQYLQENVPQARIFVEGILPCDPDFAEEYWYYDYIDDYNSAMQEMCEELGVNYFDSGFILYAHPDIYIEDGLHPTWEFYPLWLTYMARIGGLAD